MLDSPPAGGSSIQCNACAVCADEGAGGAVPGGMADGGESGCASMRAQCRASADLGAAAALTFSTYELAVLTPRTGGCHPALQVAWIKKAPPTVQKAMKPDLILVHYFDGWAEVHKDPSKCELKFPYVGAARSLVCASPVAAGWERKGKK